MLENKTKTNTLQVFNKDLSL